MNDTFGNLILKTFSEKTGGRNLVCGLCGGTRWGADGVISLPVQDSITSGMVIGGKALPLTSLTCEVCGNTLLVNLVRLLGREKFEQIKMGISIDVILNEAHKSLEVKEANRGKED